MKGARINTIATIKSIIKCILYEMTRNNPNWWSVNNVKDNAAKPVAIER